MLRMRSILNKVLNKLGYKLTCLPTPSEFKISNQVQHHIEFIRDEKFEIEFTHQILNEQHYFIPKYASHRPAVENLLNGFFHEPDTHDFVSEFCKSFQGSIIHAGTFFGDMLPNFSNSVSGTVYAFEPVLENYILARLCIDNNNLSNVTLMNMALSDSLCNLLIDTNQPNGKHAGGGSTISDKGRICPAITIDHLAIEDLRLIQLDIEGHERVALAGAIETIQKNRPVIAIEDNNANCTDFLSHMKYGKIGAIPCLSIWVPNENQHYKEKVESLLK